MRNNKNILIVTLSANVVDEENYQELVEGSKQKLEEFGYNVSFSQNFSKKYFYVSSSIKERVKDLEDGFCDDNVNLILTSQGGNNSNDLLDVIDYQKIANNPKPFLGLSDSTVLLNVIASKCNMVTYHGLDFLWGIGKNATKELTFKELELISLGKYDESFCIDSKVHDGLVVKQGIAKGVLLGGCLPSFCLLLGTKFDPICQINKDFILVIEDIGQSKSEIHSMIRQISQHRLCHLCKGIIIGNFFMCTQTPTENDRPIEEIVKEVFEGIDIPIVTIKNIGHCIENIVLPIGLECTLSASHLGFILAK